MIDDDTRRHSLKSDSADEGRHQTSPPFFHHVLGRVWRLIIGATAPRLGLLLITLQLLKGARIGQPGEAEGHNGNRAAGEL